MKTNSKLYKRVLAIALAVCMLCSVLVTGIGAGLEAKAASSATLHFYFQAPNYWPDASGTKTVTGDGTYTIELDVSSFAGVTGLQNACVEIIGFDDSDTPDSVDFSSVSMTVDGTEYYSYDYAGNHWNTGEKTVTTNGFADSFADYTWTGSEKVVATVTVTGLSFPATDDDTSATANIVIVDNVGTSSGCQVANYTNTEGVKADQWKTTVTNENGETIISVVWDAAAACYVAQWDSTEVSALELQYYANVDEAWPGCIFGVSDGETVKIYYDEENATFTTVDPNASTIIVPAAGITANTDGSVDLDAVYCVQNTKNWSGGETATEFTGWGTYTFVNHQNWTSEVALNNYFKVPNLYTMLLESGYTEEEIKEKVTLSVEVEIDGETVEAPCNVSLEKNKDTDEVASHISFQTWNPWGSDAQKAVLDAISSYIKVTMTINGPEITVTELPEEEEPEEEETKPNVKENGYVHDKGAIFVYTGSKYDIHDFVFAGYALAQIHRDVDSWGDWYEDFTKTSQNGFAPLRGNGVYIKYWDDYKGIGYPAVQLSWDTDRIYFFGLLLRSNDWTYQHDYSFNNDGFFRNEKFYTEAILDGSDRWYYFAEANYDSATEDTTTQNPVPTTEGAINVTGDGEYYTFLAIGADNNKEDWHYSWAGVQKAEEEDDKNKLPPAGMTVEAVNAKIGEQFTVSVKTETPVAYTWYVAPTIVVGADKTAVDAKVVAVRIDGKDVTDTINFAADEKTWWYEDTGIYNKANNDNKDVAARLAGGYNEWGTKYIAESPAGYTSIEYDIIINGIA